MPKNRQDNGKNTTPATLGRLSSAVALVLSAVLVFQGCFDPVYPQLDREARIMEALNTRDTRDTPPSPLTASQAVVYALANNLDAKVAEIEKAYQNESAIAARRRLLPSLNLRYSMDHSNHPSARWSESTRSGNQSLESSYSSDPNSRQGEVGMMWNLIDFGVGYLRTRQQGERIRHSEMQRRRIRQQVVLDVLSNYWRAAAVISIANEAETLKKELDAQADSIRDSVEMRILSGAEGARRELAVHGGLAELEQWRRSAAQARLELARVMGCGNAIGFTLADFPTQLPELPPVPDNDASVLQTAALQRRPELFQQDAQERIAVDEARLALLQMAPTANLSLSFYDDPDKFLEWNNWMSVGARVSWNLFNIPARLSERRVAKLQGEAAKQKGLALAAAIMAQVGIAFSDWRLSLDYAKTLTSRAEARQRLVEALAAGEKDGQTRPGEVLQERVRLLSERAAALRAAAEVRVAGARLANAIGLEVDAQGRFIWQLTDEDPTSSKKRSLVKARETILHAEERSQQVLPDEVAGLHLVKADDFATAEEYFEYAAMAPEPIPEAEDMFVAAHSEETPLEDEADDATTETASADQAESEDEMEDFEDEDDGYADSDSMDPSVGGMMESAQQDAELFRPVVPPTLEDLAEYDEQYEDALKAMAPPAGESRAGLRPVPATSFVGNASMRQRREPAAERQGGHAMSSAMATPYVSREVPLEFETRVVERQRALEPLQSFAGDEAAEGPLERIQELVLWPEPLSAAGEESVPYTFMEYESFADADFESESVAAPVVEEWIVEPPAPAPEADPLAGLRPSANPVPAPDAEPAPEIALQPAEPDEEVQADTVISLRPGPLFGAVPEQLYEETTAIDEEE